MKPIWNPAWLASGASLWCLAAKAAYATICSVGPVLRTWLGITGESRLPVWAAAASQRGPLGEALGLPVEKIRELFIGAEPLDLSARQHISLQLRWCPECAKSWYHSARFQDRRILRCPWHGCVLFEGCNVCGRAVDPMGQPWACEHCRNKLATRPAKWLDEFKQRPSHDGAWPSEMPTTHLAYSEEGMLPTYMGGDAGLEQFQSREWALSYWASGQLFESACTLGDTVLHDHLPCLLTEPGGYMSQYYQRGFRCPVAAAAGSVFGVLGGSNEASGWWPSKGLARHAVEPLPPFGNVSFEVMRSLLRELPRVWLVDALLIFGDLGNAGRKTGRWDPPELRLSTMPRRRLHGRVKLDALQKTPSVALYAAKDYAAESCPADVPKTPVDAEALLLMTLSGHLHRA